MGADDLTTGQADWISRMTAQVDTFLPEKNRGTWRTLTMKIRRNPGTGVSLSMRVINAMGMERPVEPNEIAQTAARELHNVYIAARQLTWDMLEVRFSQSKDPKDEAKSLIGCVVTVDPQKAKA